MIQSTFVPQLQIDSCNTYYFRNIKIGSANKEKELANQNNQLTPKQHAAYMKKLLNAMKVAFAEGMMNLLAEFDISVSNRLINTIAFQKKPKEYLVNYASLMGNSDAPKLAYKLKSEEAIQLFDLLNVITKDNKPDKINNRLVVYYGNQGGGKTYQATHKTDACIVCHSAMLPSDMMEDFSFVDGNPVFKKSVFFEAMENGNSLTLDEFNLLPFETVRFLQSVFDGKEVIHYKNYEIKIHPNFKVIATMNLVVNGIAYTLPEPLVDRCAEIVEFKPTAKFLASFI